MSESGKKCLGVREKRGKLERVEQRGSVIRYAVIKQLVRAREREGAYKSMEAVDRKGLLIL